MSQSGNLIGGGGAAIGNYPAQGLSLMSPQMSAQQLSNMANQQYNSQYNQYRAQQIQASLQHQQMMASMAQQKREWMINGRAMSFDEFLNELCPDDDDPMRTFLILKYKGTK